MSKCFVIAFRVHCQPGWIVKPAVNPPSRTWQHRACLFRMSTDSNHVIEADTADVVHVLAVLVVYWESCLGHDLNRPWIHVVWLDPRGKAIDFVREQFPRES